MKKCEQNVNMKKNVRHFATQREYKNRERNLKVFGKCGKMIVSRTTYQGSSRVTRPRWHSALDTALLFFCERNGRINVSFIHGNARGA